MVNLRSKSKARVATPRAALKTEPTIPTVSDCLDLSEAALRKLPRSELQKLAMTHKVKANMKSELIIRQLSSLQIPKKARPAEGNPEEGPSRKKLKRNTAREKASDSLENQVAVPPDVQVSLDNNAKDPELPKAGSSAPWLISLGQKAPTKHPYDEELFSGTESEVTEEEQQDYATPISSRAETPPPANVNDLKRCVTIMQEISDQDVTILSNVTGVRENAAKLRKKARDVRDLVRAESGRRERMETYFRYWQEIKPNWDRKWLNGEKDASDRKDSDNSAGPSAVPGSQGAEELATSVPGRKPALSPEELKQRKQAIIAKQEAEQRQLAALRRAEMQREYSSHDQSSGIAWEEHSLGHVELPSAEEKVGQGPLLISPENDGRPGTPAPSP